MPLPGHCDIATEFPLIHLDRSRVGQILNVQARLLHFSEGTSNSDRGKNLRLGIALGGYSTKVLTMFPQGKRSLCPSNRRYQRAIQIKKSRTEELDMLQENMQISRLVRAVRLELEPKAPYIVARFAASLCVAALSVATTGAQVVTGQLGSAEAGKYQVSPLDNSGFVRLFTARPSAVAAKTVFTYTGENSGIPTGNAPSILDKDYTITAEVTIPEGGGEGMIATLGGRFGGYGLFLSQSNNWWLRSTALKVEIWGLFLLGLLLAWLARNRRWTGWKTWPSYALILLTPIWLVAGLITGAAQIGKGRPIFVYNMLDLERFRWSGPALSAGKHTVVFDFKYDGPGSGKGGTGVLSVDGKEADRKTIAHTIPLLMCIDEIFDIGADTRTAVDFSYDLPFRFNGTIDKLTYNLGPSQLTAEDQRKVQDAIAKVEN
jgi:hypothetical protein